VSKPSWFNRNAALFFPEVLPAAFLVLISPIWEIQLLSRGRLLAAVLLPMGVGLGTYCFYKGCREKSRWIAHASIVGVLLTALATYKLGL
jgi:hypothetical protein